MRIALVTTSYPEHAEDAAGHFVRTEAQQLSQAGHQVVVLAPKTSNPSSSPRSTGTDDDRSAIEVIRLPGGTLFGWPGAWPRLYKNPLRIWGLNTFVQSVHSELRAQSPIDRLIAHWLLPCGWPIGNRAGLPLEVVCHGSDIELFTRLPKLIKNQIISDLLDSQVSFRFVSNNLLNQFIASTTESIRGQSVVTPSPIDVSQAPNRTTARERLNLGRHDRWIVIVARLIPSKRVEVALAAATRIQHARTVVIGDGPLRDSLERRFPQVHFTGQISRKETLTWISAADVLLSASKREGAPTVIREARALKVPVVATISGDLERWAKQDSELYIVKPVLKSV